MTSQRERRSRGRRPRPPGAKLPLKTLLADSWRVTRQVFSVLGPLSLLAHLPAAAVLTYGYLTLDDGPAVDLDVYAYIWILGSSLVIATALRGALEPLLLGFTYVVAVRAFRGEAWSVGAALGHTLRRFWPIVVVGSTYYGVSYGLGLVATGGIFAVSWSSLAMASGDLQTFIAMTGGGMIAMALAGPVGIVFALRYGFCLNEVVLDAERPMWGSFGRSAVLMRSAYIQALVVLLVGLALQVVVSTAVRGFLPPVGFPKPGDEVFELLPKAMRLQLLQEAISAPLIALVSVFTATLWALFHQRRRSVVDAPTGTIATPTDD